ncbi:HAD family hydrolase, partial [Shigella sonnei]|nr:HAD family hydrolase [Shigella sonnei]
VAKAGQLKLIYGIADEIRPEVKKALTALRRNGMKKMVMLTGDNEVTARNVATSTIDIPFSSTSLKLCF